MPDPYKSDTRAPVLVEVERFEQALVGAERVVLRVDGRYTERPGKRVLDAMLFVDDGLAVHRHAPIEDTDGPSDGWLWRAAFEVPSSYLTDARTRFALESDPGSLIDLPRPSALLETTGAVPVTARAAHIARRYAAAVAVVLAVAVAPGALPSQARTEILRVHHADGSISYVTSDGQTVATLPPDAVVIDQPAAGPAPTPAVAPAEPAASADPAPSMQATPTEGHAAEPDKGDSKPSPADTRRLGDSQAPAADEGSAKPDKPSKSDDATNGDDAQSAAPTTGKPVTGQAAPSNDATSDTSSPAHTGHKGDDSSADQVKPFTMTPPKSTEDVAPLDSMPGLATNDVPDTVNGLPALVATNDAQALEPKHQPELPSKGLEPLGDLPGGPAHGPDQTSAAPATGGATAGPSGPTGPTGPAIDDVPGLFTPPRPPVTETTPPEPADHGPSARHGHDQSHTHSTHRATRPEHEERGTGGQEAPSGGPVSGSSPTTFPGSIPATAGNYFDSLPGPGNVQGVPNFVIQRFHVPPFLLPIYQAAGIQYGIRWEVLAAINEIETDYGRNLNVSSAGALGWMQFMPSTWKMYGVDANKDHKRDPYNPVDAIFAAARYLKAAGGDNDIRRAIFAYNHAGWYVDSVMLRARLIAGYPTDLISSLTGLTEARFPVAAHARYADDEAAKSKTVGAGQNAANVIDSSETRRGIDIYAKPGSPVIAVNDGVVKEIGHDKKRGKYVVLQDVYGNRFTYSQLGSVSHLYPVPKEDAKALASSHIEPVGANDPKPTAAASAGTQRPGHAATGHGKAAKKVTKKASARPRIAAVKERLFAHPQRPVSKRHGGMDQLLASVAGNYDNYFSKPLGLNSKNATLKRLKKGSHVVGSTILGRVGDPKRDDTQQPHIHFEIQPAGKGAPKIDPKPILDGWKLLESSAVYRSKGRNVLYGDGDFSIGEIMLLPKPLLVKRVLSDPRIDIYPGGREDIATGQIDRRVLIVLEYLAESGLEPTVSCLKSGHSLMTASGNISEHSSGNAVDISAINGVPIYGHQGAGGVTEQAVKRLMMLQGTIEPHQIISLLDFGRNTMALPDHDDHIHVGFHPMFGSNKKLGREARSVLKPGQWDTLVQRLGEIQNPVVPTNPSRYALPDHDSSGE